MATDRLKSLLMLLFIASPAARSPCAAGGHPTDGMPSVESNLLEDMSDGNLERFTLLEASLIASGVHTPTEISAYEQHFADVGDQMHAARRTEREATREAAELLKWLHRHVLTGNYRPNCTELDRTFETGDYNCVTATILYRCLAELRGLEIRTMIEPGHVFCQLKGDSPTSVQTTSPGGVLREQVSSDVWLPHDHVGMQKALYRELSDVQLVAKIYYNRGVALLEQKAFAAALRLLSHASKLDADHRAARRNTLACLNNWAVSESQSGRFESALQLLEQGQALAPEHTDFQDNEVYVYYSWMRQLCTENRYAEALKVVEIACHRRPTVSLLHDCRTRISEAWCNYQQSEVGTREF